METLHLTDWLLIYCNNFITINSKPSGKHCNGYHRYFLQLYWHFSDFFERDIVLEFRSSSSLYWNNTILNGKIWPHSSGNIYIFTNNESMMARYGPSFFVFLWTTDKDEVNWKTKLILVACGLKGSRRKALYFNTIIPHTKGGALFNKIIIP